MQIVFLDSKVIISGQINISSLQNLGVLSLYPRTELSLLKQRLRGADIVLTHNVPISADAMASSRSIKLICILGNDPSLVDLTFAKKMGVAVSWVSDYCNEDIAQHTIALLMELCSHVGYHNHKIHNGAWCSSQDYCWWEKPIISLWGKSAGIIGSSPVCDVVAKLYQALGMQVLTCVVHSDGSFDCNSMQNILSHSDVISLHCPVNTGTIELINKDTIQFIKEGSYIINTSPGKIVNESDVYEALINRKIGGYATDSLSVEPPSVHNVLFKAPNCILSGHCSCTSVSARQNLINLAAQSISAFLSGKPDKFII